MPRSPSRWPGEAQAWSGLGRSYYALHNLRGATTAFNTAVTLQPNDAAAHNGLAKALVDRQCADQAEDEVNRALELERNPNLRAAYQQTQREVAKQLGAFGGVPAGVKPGVGRRQERSILPVCHPERSEGSGLGAGLDPSLRSG